MAVRKPDMRAHGRLSRADTARLALNVFAPTLAGGVLARRPTVFALEDRIDADLRALRCVQQLAERYTPGPARLALPGRSLAVVLTPEHVHRVLAGAPEPFAPANLEKRAALSHFQPHGVLISHGAHRARRREFNEAVLDTGRQVHRMAGPLVTKIHEEATQLAAAATVTGELTSQEFVAAWGRMIRRVVLGDAARDDHQLSGLLARLRREANWGPLAPTRRRTFDAFRRRLGGYLRRAEPDSLAARSAEVADKDIHPEDQVAHWLFAYDSAGLVTIRALALLVTHPTHPRDIRDEARTVDPGTPHQLPGLRATVLESARLWPTTPIVLRDTTTETDWPTGPLPAGTGLLIYAPFFHRDDRALRYAHRYTPGLWLDHPDQHEASALIPFSEGPGVCPGQNLVLLTGSTFIAGLIAEHDLALTHPEAKLDPNRPLPVTFSPYRLRFHLAPKA